MLLFFPYGKFASRWILFYYVAFSSMLQHSPVDRSQIYDIHDIHTHFWWLSNVLSLNWIGFIMEVFMIIMKVFYKDFIQII